MYAEVEMVYYTSGYVNTKVKFKLEKWVKNGCNVQIDMNLYLYIYIIYVVIKRNKGIKDKLI